MDQEALKSGLRALRVARGESLRGTARQLQLAPSYLSRLERGERVASSQVYKKLCDHFGIKTDQLAEAKPAIPAEISQILIDHPEEIVRLKLAYGTVHGRIS